jgi:predicted 2-oxoglutarate/Fe(II)-dependent dioxygenase YbiX
MLYDWYLYKDVYTKEECAEILSTAQEHKNSAYVDRPAPGKKVNTFVIPTDQLKDQLGQYFSVVNVTNDDYFGFDISRKPQSINFNIYENANNEYQYHRDASIRGGCNDIKLTAILNLSQEPYAGGEFDMFLGVDETLHGFNSPGALLVFPSFFFHRVRPVTSGRRITMSAWFKGPRLR